jgi:O-antigen/teichoic acid export membrane protein
MWSLIKNTLVYSLGDTLTKVAAVLLMPVLTRHLSTDDYGVVGVLLVFTAAVGALTNLALTNGIFRYFAYADKEGCSMAAVVWSPLLLVVAISTVSVIALCAVAEGLSVAFFGSTEYEQVIVLALITTLFGNVSVICIAVLAFQERAVLRSVMGLFQVLLGYGLTIFFVVYLGRGIAGVIEASLLSTVVACAIYCVVALRQFKLSIDLTLLRKQVKYSLPFMVTIASFWIIDSSDRYFLTMFLSLSDVGLYNVGYTIGLGMMLLVGAFTAAWRPYYHRQNKQGDGQGQAICNEVLRLYLLVGAVFIATLAVASPWLVRLLTTEPFYMAYTVVPVVAFAYFLKGPYIIFVIGILMMNKLWWIVVFEVGAAVVNVVGNILLIPVIGREAAAITTLMAYASMTLFAYVVVMRVNPIPNISRRFVVGVLAAAAIVSSSPLWIPVDSEYSWAPLILLVGLFVLVFRLARTEIERVGLFIRNGGLRRARPA